MNKLIIFFYNLSFKKVFLVSLILSLVLVIPLISFLINRETTLFSSASNEGKGVKNIDESLIPYPKEPPVIKHVEKFYGKSGDSIVILGDNFADAQKDSTLILGQQTLPKTSIAYWSDNEIEFTLPPVEGLYPIKLVVNNRSTGWWGKVDVYTDLTSETVVVNEKGNYIRVFDPTLRVITYSINGNVNVLGTSLIDNRKADVPVDLSSSNIVNLEILKNGLPISFKVVSAK